MLPATNSAYEECFEQSHVPGIKPPEVQAPTHGLPTVVDLCCGMGGLSLAARNLGMRVAAGVDLNAHAARTFKKNFPEAEFLEGSVRSSKILERCLEHLKPLSDVPNTSVVLSGPPCQGFSTAGSRDPVDPRNQILVAVARAIVALRPSGALVENVSTILSDIHKKRLDAFKTVLASAGYFVGSVLLDAADFGVPQRRKRVFFLVSPGRLDSKKIQERLKNLQQPQQNVQNAFAGLNEPEVRPDDYSDDGDYADVANHFAMRHSKSVMAKIAALKPGSGPMSYRKLHPERPSNTLFSGHRAPPAHFKEPRSITVREAARLQGFPDSFRIYGSFGNQMQQVTNAVPPPLAAAILKVLLELIGPTTASHA